MQSRRVQDQTRRRRVWRERDPRRVSQRLRRGSGVSSASTRVAGARSTRGHGRHRSATRVSRRVRSRPRRRRWRPGASNAPVQQRGQLPRPLARHHGPRAVSQRRRVQDSERARLGTMLQDEPPVQHRVSRVRRTASRALRGDVDGSHRETARPHPGIDPREEHVPRGRRVSLWAGDGVVAASRVLGRRHGGGAPPAARSPLAAPPPRRSTRGTDTKNAASPPSPSSSASRSPPCS